MAIEKLPHELLMEILSWLPVLYVLRCRSVSKHWFSIIQNPSFISLHHNRAASIAQKHRCLILKRLLRGGDRAGDVVISLVQDETAVQDLNVSFMGLDLKVLQLLGPCNGVVCLTRYGFPSTTVLYNPSLREFRVLPQPPSYKDYMATLGFGFDSVSNDYKLVRFEITNPDTFKKVDDQNVQIYNLSTDSWKETDVPVPDNIFCSYYSCVSWNGDFYWYGLSYGADRAIIWFDMIHEVFYEMPVPEVCLLDNDSECKLFIMNDSLALVLYPTQFSIGDYYLTKKCFDIWVMDESVDEVSWSKILTVGPLLGLDGALGFRENGEFLVESGNGQMKSYNVRTGEIKEYQVYGRPPYSLEVLPYIESLVSVKRHIEHEEE